MSGERQVMLTFCAFRLLNWPSGGNPTDEAEHYTAAILGRIRITHVVRGHPATEVSICPGMKSTWHVYSLGKNIGTRHLLSPSSFAFDGLLLVTYLLPYGNTVRRQVL